MLRRSSALIGTLVALPASLSGCPEDLGPYPEVGKWEGPGVLHDGWGALLVPNEGDTVYTYRAALTWPDGKSFDYRHVFTGGGGGLDEAVTIEDDAIVVRLNLDGHTKLPFNVRVCRGENCGVQGKGNRSFDLGWGLNLLPAGDTAQGIVMPPAALTLAVGERRAYQAYPWAQIPFGFQLATGGGRQQGQRWPSA